jgi:hypothetical protein
LIAWLSQIGRLPLARSLAIQHGGQIAGFAQPQRTAVTSTDAQGHHPDIFAWLESL